jgi:hypothetical protein
MLSERMQNAHLPRTGSPPPSFGDGVGKKDGATNARPAFASRAPMEEASVPRNPSPPHTRASGSLPPLALASDLAAPSRLRQSGHPVTACKLHKPTPKHDALARLFFCPSFSNKMFLNFSGRAQQSLRAELQVQLTFCYFPNVAFGAAVCHSLSVLFH